MKFNPEKKDLLPTGKTETTANEQDLGWEELSDEAAAAIQGGGRRRTSSSTTTADAIYNRAAARATTRIEAPAEPIINLNNLTALAGG